VLFRSSREEHLSRHCTSVQ